MSTPPRRRRPDARRPQPDGGGWLRTIAMGAGVIVAGLGIGVLVAVFTQQRTTEKAPAALKPVSAETSTPAASTPAGPPIQRPIAIATLMPPRTPRPSTSPRSSLALTPAPSLEPSLAPSSPPTRAALVVTDSAPTATPERVAVITPTPAASAATSSGATSTVATSSVAASPASASSQAASPAGASLQAPSSTGDSAAAASPVGASPATAAPSSAFVSAYDEHASAVVRRYVDALIRGDEKTAYSALGASGGALSEQAFLDPSARIVSLKVTRIDASNASVGCEIAAAKGHFYATYHVTAASAGPYISQHDYIKV